MPLFVQDVGGIRRAMQPIIPEVIAKWRWTCLGDIRLP